MRAPALGLRDGDRQRLESWLRSSTIAAGLAQRARIVLLAADGLTNVEIAERVGVSRPTVNELAGPVCAQRDRPGWPMRPRPGRPRTIDHRRIVAATLKAPPKSSG